MLEVWLAPYLPWRDEAIVGLWRLVPFEGFGRRHATQLQVFNDVRRLRTAYKLRDTAGMPFGAIVLPREGRVGEEMPRESMRPLQRSILAALLDANPSLLDADDDPNAGHKIAAAGNAVLFAHPLHGGHSYAIAEGAMVRRVSIRTTEPGRPLPRIQSPPELPTPFFAAFDAEYASAIYRTLTLDDQRSRRLDRAIEWLGLGWNNNAGVTEDARVLVFRAAFEALLGGGASTKRNRQLLSKLRDKPTEARTPKSWPGLKGGPVVLTELEWWFQSFALLRNKIAHGDEIAPADWLFDDGKRHLWHADAQLRRAIKQVVIDAGHDPRLALPHADRELARAYEEAVGVVPARLVP